MLEAHILRFFGGCSTSPQIKGDELQTCQGQRIVQASTHRLKTPGSDIQWEEDGHTVQFWDIFEQYRIGGLFMGRSGPILI
jgi:hypothetical protein